MGVSQAPPINAVEIRRACEEALWAPSGQSAEQRARIALMEGYVRLLAPKLRTLVPRMQDNVQNTARVVLKQTDKILSGAPSADPAKRLFDSATYARALLTLLERPGTLTPSGEAPEQAQAAASSL